MMRYTKFYFYAAITGLCLIAVSQRSGAQTNINLSTGLDSSGNVITTDLGYDANWTASTPLLALGPAQTVHSQDADYFSGWVPNNTSSDWIAINAATANNGPAPYSFTTKFDLTGLDPSSVTTSGLSWTIDDGGILYLNGQQISSLNSESPSTSSPWTTLNPFTLPLGDLNQGVNTLTMTMTNADENLEGARLQGTITAGPAQTGHFVGYNENFQNLTGSPQSQVNIVLQGDWTNLIKVNFPTFGQGNTGFTSTYANGVTTLSIYSLNGATLPTGTQNPPPHVGYSLYNGPGGGEGASPPTLSKYLGAAQTNPAASLRLPAPTFFVNNPGAGANTKFLISFADVQLAGGGIGGEWSELQVPNNQNVKIQIGNYDTNDGPLFISDAKFFLSDTMIPLDDLNSIYEPPTGSQFQPLPGIPDGTQVNPGDSASSSDITVPEPTALGLLLLGGAGLLGRRRKISR